MNWYWFMNLSLINLSKLHFDCISHSPSKNTHIIIPDLISKDYWFCKLKLDTNYFKLDNLFQASKPARSGSLIDLWCRGPRYVVAALDSCLFLNQLVLTDSCIKWSSWGRNPSRDFTDFSIYLCTYRLVLLEK